MKFGKLSDISGVDFSLPANPEVNQALLEPFRAEHADFTFYAGCTGWSMTEWVGRWYPKGTKSKDFLYHYSRQFNTIEFNTTHYRIPSLEQVQKWCEQVPDDFRFCPKIPQRISHSRNLGLGTDQLPLFWEALEHFSTSLGACFMQLPPYFGFDRLAELERFLMTWPEAFPLAMEMRHESWFANAEVEDEWSALFAAHGIATVITDVSGRRDVLHQRLTNKLTMIRFVGNGLHPSDYDRIREWGRQLVEWREQGLQTVYFFPHQPDNLLAPDMTEFLVKHLLETTTIKTRGPVPIPSQTEGGEQISLF
ncbi:MAG: DUF72 domain-containing protein [Bacteroidota bacterium]